MIPGYSCIYLLQDPTDIAQYQAAIQNSIAVNMADNVALVVLYPDSTGGATEEDIVEALKGKYDALKDKLLAEALMREVSWELNEDFYFNP